MGSAGINQITDMTDYASTSSERLAQMAAAGDLGAFDEIISRLHGLLVKVIGATFRDWDLVEELEQEVFVRLYRSLTDAAGGGGYDPARPLWPWVRQIAVNTVREKLRELRRDRDRREALIQQAMIEQQARRGEGELAGETFDFLDECLGRLSQRARRTVKLYYDEQVSCDRIAEVLDMSAAAVRMALKRTREALRDCIASQIEARAGAQA